MCIKDEKPTRPNGYVSAEKIDEAIGYFFENGAIDNCLSDERYYVTILLAHAANTKNIHLVGLDLENGGTMDEDEMEKKGLI